MSTFDDERRALARCEADWLREPEHNEPERDADDAPAVTGPFPGEACGSCECCGDPAPLVFEVFARISTATLCRVCLETLAAEIARALAAEEP